MTLLLKRSGYALVFIASIAVLCAAVAAAIRQPIYPDEVSYKIFLGRYFLNGGFKQSLMPYCAHGFLVAAPTLLLPAAALWSLISAMGYGWLSYRVLPLTALLFIVATLSLRSAVQRRWPLWPSFLILCCGPTIYSLILLRPEIIIIAVALAIFLLLRLLTTETRSFVILPIGMLVLFLLSLILFIHPKALYLAPLCLGGFVCLALVARRRVLVGIYGALIALTCLLVAASLSFQQTQHLACPEASFIEANFSGQAVNPLQLFVAPTRFLQSLAAAFSGKMLYVKTMLFQFHTQYQLGYLPPSTHLPHVMRLANVGFVAVVISAFAFVFVRIARGLLTQKSATRRIEWILLLLLSLGLFVPVLLNLSAAFYEAAFFVGAVVVTLDLTRTAARPPRGRTSTITARCATIVGGLILFVLAVLSVHHMRGSFTPAFDAHYFGLGYERDAKDTVVKAAVANVAAGIAPMAPMITDDLTYEFMQTHPIIMPITYLGLAAVSDPAEVQHAVEHYDVHFAVVRCVSFVADWFPGWIKVKEVDSPGNFRNICLFQRPYK